MKTRSTFVLLLVLAAQWLPNLGYAQFAQQGNKLEGSGATPFADQGYSVALSADGNTALAGGNSDNNGAGAAWIFTRTGGVWSQQGTKLTAIDTTGASSFGWSASLSADGNTALLGGVNDDSGAGAMWLFTRTSGVWSQLGTKFVGTGAIGKGQQGTSVALSGDGNTAIVGGAYDDSGVGAVWIYIHVGSIWSQQGSKLVGTGAVGTSYQGRSVALSFDGNTAIVGGYGDSSYAGATWVFTRTGRTWSQEGGKLFGTGTVGNADQGQSVALSADGNTAIVGGYGDSTFRGAGWVFTRTGSAWSQQGSKLVGSGAAGAFAEQGSSVSVSADGNTAVIGGSGDNGSAGATWVFTRSGSIWSQLGSKLVGTGAVGIASQAYAVSLSGDGNTILVGGPFDNSSTGASWVFTRGVTGVRERSEGRPSGYRLAQNYPNPFNPTTTILFEVPYSGFVSLKVYDLLGRELLTLVNGDLTAGAYEASIDASLFPSGAYFYRLTASRAAEPGSSFSQVKAMLLLK